MSRRHLSEGSAGEPTGLVVDSLAATSASRGAIVLAAVVAALVGFADVPLVVPAFNTVLRGSPILSVLCAVAFSIVLLIAAFLSGREARRGHPLLSLVLGAGSVGVIAGIFLLRVLAASLLVTAPAFEDAVTAEAPNEWPIATVMALLMLGTSALAWVDGYVLTPPPAVARLRLLERVVEEGRDGVTRAEAQRARAAEDLAAAEHRLATLDDDEDAAAAGLDALRDELQELARIEIARHLGDPAATSHLDHPIHPVR